MVLPVKVMGLLVDRLVSTAIFIVVVEISPLVALKRPERLPTLSVPAYCVPVVVTLPVKILSPTTSSLELFDEVAVVPIRITSLLISLG